MGFCGQGERHQRCYFWIDGHKCCPEIRLRDMKSKRADWRHMAERQKGGFYCGYQPFIHSFINAIRSYLARSSPLIVVNPFNFSDNMVMMVKLYYDDTFWYFNDAFKMTRFPDCDYSFQFGWQHVDDDDASWCFLHDEMTTWWWFLPATAFQCIQRTLCYCKYFDDDYHVKMTMTMPRTITTTTTSLQW